MFRIAMSTVALAGLLAMSGTAAVEQGSQDTVQQKQKEKPKQRRWSGTATATCKCSDGKCVPLVCSVSAQLTYEVARDRLRIMIEAEATRRGGQIEGSISFSIRADF